MVCSSFGQTQEPGALAAILNHNTIEVYAGLGTAGHTQSNTITSETYLSIGYWGGKPVYFWVRFLLK